MSAADEKLRVIAVLSLAPKEARRYLDGLEIPISDIKQIGANQLKVSLTPTLLLVDEKGVVSASWEGQLSANEEDEVLASIEAR